MHSIIMTNSHSLLACVALLNPLIEPFKYITVSSEFCKLIIHLSENMSSILEQFEIQMLELVAQEKFMPILTFHIVI